MLTASPTRPTWIPTDLSGRSAFTLPLLLGLDPAFRGVCHAPTPPLNEQTSHTMLEMRPRSLVLMDEAAFFWERGSISVQP